MKSVCAKHDQAFELECPWCEKKAEGPTAAPAAPPVAVAKCNAMSCNLPVLWRWEAIAEPAKTTAKTFRCSVQYLCDLHQIKSAPDHARYFAQGWQTERLP